MNWFTPQSWFQKPHPLIVKNNRHFENFDQTRELRHYDFVVLDTELTGLNRRTDEIVSIGAVRIVNLKINFEDTFYRVVRPDTIDHNRSTLVHQISPSELKKAKALPEVLPAFVDYIGNAVIVGHFLNLDMSFINKATRKLMGGYLSNPGIDTMRLSHGYRRTKEGFFNQHGQNPQYYRLEYLSKEFGLPPFLSHNSFEDAFQTACLFMFLSKKFKKAGLRSLRDLRSAGHNLHI